MAKRMRQGRRTFDEWIAVHNDFHTIPYQPDPANIIIFEPERGILALRPLTKEVLNLVLWVGDGRYWGAKAVEFAKLNGFKKIWGVSMHRGHKAFERMLGANVVGYVMEREVE